MTKSSNVDVERRESFRLDMEKELVDLLWVNEQGIERTKKIACLDFAKGGLRIDSDEEICEATEITVTFKGNTAHKQIIHTKVLRCIEQKNGWFEIALVVQISK